LLHFRLASNRVLVVYCLSVVGCRLETLMSPNDAPASTLPFEGTGGLEPQGTLIARTVPVCEVNAQTRAQAFALFQRAYEATDRARFERDFSEKQLCILLRDRGDHALKGFSTVHLRRVECGDVAGTLIFSGDTVIDRAYWGQKQLQLAFVRLLIGQKLRAPRRKLYWFLVSKGWRTYILMANAFPHAVPRYDRADDPLLRSLLDHVAAARFGAQYDPACGVVRYATPHERVREGLAPVTEGLQVNPHVRFFAERNPGHLKGNELACLAEVRLRDVARTVARLSVVIARRTLGVTAKTGPGQ
jgi:hypothetical protein